MTLFSLLLLVLAAVLHALSNALIKRSRDKLAFTWWMLTAWAIIGFPLIFFVGQPPLIAAARRWRWPQRGLQRPAGPAEYRWPFRRA